MAADKKSGGVIIARASTIFVTPPGLAGWSHLIDPDEYQPPDGPLQKNFDINFHQNEQQFAALVNRLGSLVESALWPAFLIAADKAGQAQRTVVTRGKSSKVDWVMPSAQEYLDTQVKVPGEGSKIELPFIKFKNAAYFKDKAGDSVLKTIRATDADGHAVDLKAARMGMGSTVQILLTPSVYASPAINKGDPSLSLKLQGIRIIHLEQYGSGGPSLGEMTEEDMALMGDGINVEDLSGYAKGPEVFKPKATREGTDLEDEEIPF